MDISGKARQSLFWFAATAAAALTTFVLALLDAHSTAAGMVFLVLVVWWAAQAGIVLSIYTAILCALCFDYFFLPPVHTFRIEGPQAWVAMVSFALSCIVVSRLAERARHQTQQAEQREADVERLYELSQEMMLFEDADRLLHDLPGAIHRIFALSGAILFVAEPERFFSSTGETPASVKAHIQAVTQGLSPANTSFGGYQTAALMLGMRPIGALAWQPDSLSHEVATAVSAQVSIAVARAIAMAAKTRVEAAREADRLRTSLVDSLTHELRTPLTSIRAASTTLLDASGLDEAGRLDMARIIDEEAARLDQLIGDAVEMAEIDANTVRVKLSPLNPHSFLEEIVEESRRILTAHKVTIMPGGDGDPEEESGPVWFDPRLLGRVLRHILENAARYTPPGSRITLSSQRSEDRLIFSVEDNGPGIDARDLPLIFDKFYRGKRGAKQPKGSGMGLAIVRSILKVHGGGIEVSSPPGSGACFRFWVPLIDRQPSRSVS